MKTCNACKNSFEESDFSKAYRRGDKQYYRGECKRCQSQTNQQKEALGNAMKRPHNYMECWGCDRVFYKYTEPAKRTKKKKECPKCKSENISDYE